MQFAIPLSVLFVFIAITNEQQFYDAETGNDKNKEMKEKKQILNFELKRRRRKKSAFGCDHLLFLSLFRTRFSILFRIYSRACICTSVREFYTYERIIALLFFSLVKA